MQHKPNSGFASATAESAFDQALLGLLIHDHPGLWSLAELTRSLTSSSQTTGGDEPPTHETENAIERLYAAGLIHRIGNYVFATHAARTADHLAG
jgi:hypothetical protein